MNCWVMEIHIFIGICFREKQAISRIMGTTGKVLFGGIQWKKCTMTVITLLIRN